MGNLISFALGVALTMLTVLHCPYVNDWVVQQGIIAHVEYLMEQAQEGE